MKPRKIIRRELPQEVAIFDEVYKLIPCQIVPYPANKEGGYYVSSKVNMCSLTLMSTRIHSGRVTTNMGRGKKRPISRIVAQIWIPNPENKPCVCHKDNNPLNNNVDNLYWGSYKDNINQCIRDKRFKPGGKTLRRFISRRQIRRARRLYLLGWKTSDIAYGLNYSPSVITRILNKSHRYLDRGLIS